MAGSEIKPAMSLDGLDAAIDAIGRLFIVVWEKSPTLVWTVVMLSFLAIIYWIHCSSMRRDEKLIKSQTPSSKSLKPGSKKKLSGVKKNV